MLFYPKTKLNKEKNNYENTYYFKNLIFLITNTIEQAGMSVYNVNNLIHINKNEFRTTPIYLGEAKKLLGESVEETDWGEIINVDYNSNEIKAYRVKELYLYNKNKDIIGVRTIGISPIREYKDNEEIKTKQTFWVMYKDLQQIPYFVNKNTFKFKCSDNNTFDQIFFNQKYNAKEYYSVSVNLEDDKEFFSKFGIVFF